jgi:hypothetical protein
MKKIVALSILCLVFVGCEGVNNDLEKFQTINIPAEFSLDCGEDCVKPKLKLVDDKTFNMTFNLCESMAIGEGTYTKIGNKYSLQVNRCLSCENGNNNGLPTVKFDLEQTSDDELLITSEVTREQNGQTLWFCAPTNDPYDKYDGVDYNLFRLVKGY